MEKIKKALDLVKDEGGIMSERAYPLTGNESVQVRRFLNSTKITYKKTRRFKPSSSILKEKRIISTNSAGEIENVYKIMRTQVLQHLKKNGWNAFGVVSTRQGEGKTLTAINLAVSISQETQYTVLLVDFDLRDPSIHDFFGCSVEYGVSDYLYDDKPIENILFNPGIDGLVVLPCTKPIVNSSEALSSPKVSDLVSELKFRYSNRIVIFDLPSLLSSDDVIAFSPYIESVLMVIEDGQTGCEDLLQAIDYLKTTTLIGTVLNKSGHKVTLK